MSTKPHAIKIAEQVPQGTRIVSMPISDWTTIVNEHLAFSRKYQALEQRLAVAVTKLKAISDNAYEKQHQCDCEAIAQEALALINADRGEK